MARRKREPMSEGKKNISNRQIIRSRYNVSIKPSAPSSPMSNKV